MVTTMEFVINAAKLGLTAVLGVIFAVALGTGLGVAIIFTLRFAQGVLRTLGMGF